MTGPASAFVGRDGDLASLRERLADAQLVTVLGPGGVGKSRLAHHLADVHSELWPGGVLRVDLSEARGGHDVLVAVAEAAGLTVPPSKALHTLGLDLGDRAPSLLLLDNADRCVDGVAWALQTWLGQAPDMAFLVTSRRPLALAHERRHTLDPLSEADAVALFEARVRAAGVDLAEGEQQAARELVRRLDGIPLAVELAAGRASAFTPTELLHRLDERFRLLRTRRRDVAERHMTLRRTIDWSWELLTPWEQDALAQCAVFRGGFSMDAAEAVLVLDDPDAWVPDAIQSLADQALVRGRPSPGFPGEMRFSLYASVREYLLSRSDLAESLAAATHRHAVWALGHAERWAADAERAGLSSVGLRRLALERDNVLAVYRQATPDRPEVALRALLALNILMHWSGSTQVQLDRLTRVLGDAEGLPPELVERGRVARSLAALWCGRVAEARAELEGVLERAQGGDGPAGSRAALVARSLLVLSQASYYADDVEEAANCARQALAIGEESGDVSMQAHAHARLAMALSVQEPRSAHQHYLAAVKLERSQGNRIGASFGVARLAQSATEPSLVIDTLGQWLSVVRDIGSAVGEGALLGDLAESHARMGQLDTAADLVRQAIASSERAGNRAGLVRHLSRLGWIEQARGDTASAQVAYSRARRKARAEGASVQEAIVLANEGSLLHELGAVSAALDKYAEAVAATAGRDLRWLDGVVALRRAMALADGGEIPAARATLASAEERLSTADEHRAVGLGALFVSLAEARRRTDTRGTAEVQAEADALLAAHRREREWAFRTENGPLDEVGLAHRLLTRAVRATEAMAGTDQAELRVTPDGSAFQFRGAEADLSRRKALRLILRALAERRDTAPGEVIALHDLVDSGWPGERTLPDAGANRVYSAVRDLRKLGLRDVLTRADDGYRLDPKVSFAWDG
ncbi:MAG: putative ATPase [Myxococcota bacterium]|jgi:predicted ATPase